MSTIFWLFAVCVLGVLSTPFIVIFIIGIRKRSRVMKWLGGIPAAGFLSLAGLVLIAVFIGMVHPFWETTSSKKIHESFVSTFNFQPGSDFVPLHQGVLGVNDAGRLYLQFQASPATFEKIQAMKFEPIKQWEFFEFTGGPNAPTWWLPTNQIGGVYYQNSEWKGPYNGNRAHIFYLAESNMVCFCTKGSD